ncbi:FCD domain-containing protein, partial [Thioclava sp. BHET1]
LLGNYFYFHKLSIDDIYQIREVLEPELAASLAGKLDADQLAQLEEVMQSYARPAESAEEEREQHIASLRFHALLAEMSGNPLLRFLIRFLASLLSEITVTRKLYEPPNPELWSSGTAYQVRLLEALRDNQPEEARAILAQHMRNAHRLMRLQEAALTRRFLPEGALL